MTTQPYSYRLNSQRGVSLVELMISMVIGLIITLAATAAYLGASGAGKVAEVQSRMNEDAQIALSILSQQLRLAGSNPARINRAPASLHNPLTNLFAIRGCDLVFSDVTSATSAAALTCGGTATSTGPDSISIGYEADAYNTVPTSASVPTDCMGSALTSSTQVVTAASGGTSTVGVFEAENRYYIGTSTAIVNPSLYCKGNATTAQPIVENVENLQISYGVSNPNVTPSAVLGYLSAYGVDNDTTTLNGKTQQQRWDSVITVRICIVVRSPDPVAPDLQSAKYLDCSGTLTTVSDLRLRRAYTTTVVLRNNQQ